MWDTNVVLPEDSGPYISIIRPRGTPPIPSAISTVRAPVEIDSICFFAEASPSFTIAPSPYCF